MPSGAWIQAQVWDDLLFAHWPIAADVMRRLVPAVLDLDLYDGQAWVGIVPFGISGLHLRYLPSIPGLAAFPEINVRTYVTVGGKPGVYFFSLDVTNPLAVLAARVWYRLPYFQARMSHTREGEWEQYSSQRLHGNAEFVGRYRPIGQVTLPVPGTHEHWLTERYCLYAVDSGNRVFRGEIHHAAWPLQPAEAHIEQNTMAQSASLELPAIAPLLHFSRRQEVIIWPPVRV
ncbi:MAG: DUF2071 domain-containing protein [Chloroflexota bacterium]